MLAYTSGDSIRAGFFAASDADRFYTYRCCRTKASPRRQSLLTSTGAIEIQDDVPSSCTPDGKTALHFKSNNSTAMDHL
nr:hypothetical protein CFP56_79519 [Quercus suber]